MSRDRLIVIGGHVVWLCLMMWTAVVPRGVFPNTASLLGGIPWTYIWLILLVILWCLMLPAILRDSRIHSGAEGGQDESSN